MCSLLQMASVPSKNNNRQVHFGLPVVVRHGYNQASPPFPPRQFRLELVFAAHRRPPPASNNVPENTQRAL